MRMNPIRIAPLATLLIGLTVPPAVAERLTMSFLPPDLPPGNVCNAPAERFEDDETQIVGAEEPGEQILDDTGRLEFLARDIRNIRRNDPDGSFDFIMALISRRAELDSRYAGLEETLDRVDTYLAAGRLEELEAAGLIGSLTESREEMGWSQAVRLARFYMNGIGVEKDREFAIGLIVDQAYLGSASALLEVLRMQLRGEEIEDWTLTPERTAELAFGGLIGRPNRGLCNRAERMAREYTDGDLLTPNPNLAFAWRKFAADMGGAEAAWRVVEHHLSESGEDQNTGTLRHYLQKAVGNGFVILPENVDEIVANGAKTEAEVRRILGLNYAELGQSDRLSAVPYFDLDVRILAASIAEDGEYLQYLREISVLPGVPGTVLTRLAKEVMLRKGRWAGEDEAKSLFREAARLGDPESALALARILMQDRRSPEKVAEIEVLLGDAVARHGHTNAMRALETLYRCQLPDAPRISEAAFWADAQSAANLEPVVVSMTDIARFDARREPEAVARIQGLAVRGHSGSSADWLQFLQSDHTTPENALRYWAGRVSRSDVALEKYMLQEFELALTAADRRSAVELFRRVYLSIGSAISLELALALVEDAGRDPVVADEIRELLTNSANRGQGAAVRLLQRLTGRDAAEVYEQFTDAIDTRGDFIALVYAAPLVSDEVFERYMDRAVSLMNCTTKDITELTEAHAMRGLDEDALHWLRVGLAVEGGNSLMRLGLSTRQTADFDRGVSIAQDMLQGPMPVGETFDRHRQLYLAAADPRDPEFDPVSAGENLAAILGMDDREQYLWAITQYRKADPAVRDATDGQIDVRAGLRSAAETGDDAAQYELGMLLRTLASTPSDLEISNEWLSQAAKSGNGDAMVEYALAIGFGVGRPADPKLALIWLERAEGLYPGRGRELRRTLSAMVGE